MKTLLLLLAGLLALAGHAQQKPNIILIVADDLGYADIGCYGQKKIATPHIDQLAKQGMRFTQFYAGSTVCAPSRNSLLTGMHTGHISVRGNKGTKPEGQTPLPDSVVTIASVLEQNGYRTAAYGKWGLGFITTSGDPNKKGFEQFFGYNCQTLAHNYYPDHLWSNHQRINLPENKNANSIYSADYIHAHAMDFLNSRQNKPFFLYLPYTLPHGDVITPHDSVYQYYVRKFNEPALTEKKKMNDGEEHRFEPYPHAAFATMIARLDRYIGEIMQGLASNGMAENTLVLFTSDNGPHREHGGDPEFFNNNGIFRGIKRDLYEGGIRVPMIAYWKGKILPAETKQVAALWDLFPTFQQLAGIQVSKNLDGISLLPTLLKKGKQPQHEYLYWEFHENEGRQAVRSKEWKAVRLGVNSNDSAPIELYNLEKDHSEEKNLADKYPQVVKRMAAYIQQAHVSNPNWPLLPAEIKQ